SAPGAGGGTFSNFFSEFGPPALSNTGQVAFTAGITGASDGSATGIFRGDGNSIVSIARQKQIAPNTAGATFNGIGNNFLGIAPGGQVAFVASLAGTLDGLSTDNGIFVGDGQD